jgi:hypothetical protein
MSDEEEAQREAHKEALGRMTEPRGNALREAAWRQAQLLGLHATLREGRELSPEQHSFLISEEARWLSKNWGSRPCPYCENTSWQLGTPVELLDLSGVPMHPSFPVMCSQCGNTVFINAIKAGLWPEPDES